MAKHKLTKRFIDDLPLSSEKQTYYWDTDLRGFGLSVSAKSKTYVVQRDINGKGRRIKIGKHGVVTTDQARKQAQQLLAQMAQGIDPKKVREEKRIQGMTLADLWKEYRANAESRLSPRTIVGYEDYMSIQFSEWQRLPIADINKDMIVKRHQKVTKESGKVAANNSLQFLRALYNYALIDNDKLVNPVIILSQKKLWHKKERRQSIIRQHELADWYAAVMNLQNATIRDALRLILFTGLRKNEAFTLKWDQVDFKDRSFKILETKNKETLELPLSDFLYDLLESRYKHKGDSPYVFPGGGKSGHLVEPKKAINQITEATGIRFMLHDLRRTFITTAEQLDISAYALKHLVNHKTGNDVTSGYIVMNVDRLREPMEKISQYFVKICL